MAPDPNPIVLPDAVYSPYPSKSQTPVRVDFLVLHTEVGTNEGSINIGGQAGHSYAHNYTDCLGVTHQKQSLRYRSASVLDANPYALAWETEDYDDRCFAPWDFRCGHVPAWTDAQCERLARDLAYCCQRFDVPASLVPDTRLGRRGICYHRQGVPGSPEWVPGSLAMSSSPGKCCPDWRRIAQVTQVIIPRVRQLLTPPPPVQEDDMKPMLIKRPRDNAVFLYVDGVKQWQNNQSAINENLWNYAVAGNPIQTQAGGVPFDWLDWQVDRIPPQLPTVEGLQGDDWNDPVEIRRARGHLMYALNTDPAGGPFSFPRFLEGTHFHALNADLDSDATAAKLDEIDGEVDHIIDMMHDEPPMPTGNGEPPPFP